MVLWCKGCGALMGVREPFHDWKVDRNSLCRFCAPVDIVIAAKELTEVNDTGVIQETISSAAVPE